MSRAVRVLSLCASIALALAGSCFEVPSTSGTIAFEGLSLKMDMQSLSASGSITVEKGTTKTLDLGGRTRFDGFLVVAAGATLTTSEPTGQNCGDDGGAVTNSSTAGMSSLTMTYTSPPTIGTYTIVVSVSAITSTPLTKKWHRTSFAVEVVEPGESTVVYTHSDGKQYFSINECCAMGYCPSGTGTRTKQQQCFMHSPVLDPTLGVASQAALNMAIEHNSVAHMCNFQQAVCTGMSTFHEPSAECGALMGSCQTALRHLHVMMFNQSPLQTEPQVCNNFARKSVRGFFHDFMSNGIDGSILTEHDLAHNFGLCRWAQYINVLADETGCDPGSVIAMAGQLGYDACGVAGCTSGTLTSP